MNLPGKLLAIAALLLCGCHSSPQELQVKFATVAEGQRILLTPDPFLQELRQSDVNSRLCSAQLTSIESYRDTLRSCVLEWAEEEKRDLLSLFDSINRTDSDLIKLLGQREIVLIKTSGTESLDAFYTRQNAIILPSTSFGWVQSKVELLRHELFHILSRSNATARAKLYALLGYRIAPRPILIPDSIRKSLLHNPDSPLLDYYQQSVDSAGRTIFTTVVLMHYGLCLFDSIVATELNLRHIDEQLHIQSLRSAPELDDVPDEVLANAYQADRSGSVLARSIDSVLKEINSVK